MKNRLILFSVTAFIILTVLLPAAPALADCDTGNFLPPCTCSGQCKLTDFLALGANIMKYAVGALAAVAIGFIINGGFTLLMAMGNSEKIDSGKKQLGGTFKGVAMVMLTWILVSTIIFFLTGKSDGLLFGRGEKWWNFKETQLYEMYLPYEPGSYCPVRTFAPPANVTCTTYNFYLNPQTCTDTSSYDDAAKASGYCRKLGVCAGGPEMLCCDQGKATSCPTSDDVKKYITGE
ncbi:MAG: pilin [Patescibacteria group bacterium]|jgi:hypothetical protein